MHALAAHGYHLLLRAVGFASLPTWRPLLAALTIALATRAIHRGRPAGPGHSCGGAVAVLAGWIVLSPGLSWPLPPVGRLPGLAVLTLVQASLPLRVQGSWPTASALAALSAWWLCGAPATWVALAECLPVLVGLLAGQASARRLARDDVGWGTLAAALALAGSLRVSGAAPHWALAALAPAIVALVLLGVAHASSTLSCLVVYVAAATLVASDRGRLLPVDVACLAPLLAWALVGQLTSLRLARPPSPFGPAVAVVLAALLCTSLAWVTTRF